MTQTIGKEYLRIENLWKLFGDFVALEDISLVVNEGEFVCFLGPSGCGKTTLLRAIAGLDHQTRGTIVQENTDVSALPPSERNFGIVFQSYALFPNLSIRRNVAFGLENTGRDKEKIATRVDELLNLVGLPEQGEKYPAQLSGGQQQRIALARAIATSPGLLLLDEPLSALDAKVRVHLRHEVKELQRKLGVTTIMVTHDQEEALSMADRIVVMNEGTIEQIGTPSEVYGQPRTLFVADFIGEMNQMPATTVTGSQVQIGDCVFDCAPHDFGEHVDVIAAIRPDDVVPSSPTDGHLSVDANSQNFRVRDMEFLGSFWRCHLENDNFKTAGLIADFSANAVRRLNLQSGEMLTIQLPSENLVVFERPIEQPRELS